MSKVPPNEDLGQRFIKEFAPHDRNIPLSAGKLVIRADNYDSRLSKFDRLFEVLAADALTFEPPIELDRSDVEVVHYGGRIYSGTFGLEVAIPEGHVIPTDYDRIREVELLR